MNNFKNILGGFESLDIELIKHEMTDINTICQVNKSIFFSLLNDIFDKVIHSWTTVVDFKAVELMQNVSTERSYVFVNSKGMSYLSVKFLFDDEGNVIDILNGVLLEDDFMVLSLDGNDVIINQSFSYVLRFYEEDKIGFVQSSVDKGIEDCKSAISYLNDYLLKDSLNTHHLLEWLSSYSYLSNYNFIENRERESIYRYKVETTKLINFFTKLIKIMDPSFSTIDGLDHMKRNENLQVSQKLAYLEFIQSVMICSNVRFGDDYIFYEDYNIKLVGLEHIFNVLNRDENHLLN